MSQRVYPAKPREDREIEHRMLILYFLQRMELPTPLGAIVDFVCSGSYMHFYLLHEYLEEMKKLDYMMEIKDDDIIRYVITETGNAALSTFDSYLSLGMKEQIGEYAKKKHPKIKREMDIAAKYFFDEETEEYLTKLSVYDEKILLMEINMNVVSREIAEFICTNWRNNVDNIYGKVTELLITKKS